MRSFDRKTNEAEVSEHVSQADQFYRPPSVVVKGSFAQEYIK
jgi:hypothetical protein